MFGKNEYKKPTEKQEIGKIGEDEACKYLRSSGYSVDTRNYSRKWGEIDIVSRKGSTIHFIEVKSVTCPIRSGSALRALGASNGVNETYGECVTHETDDRYRPEDNMHPWKLRRLSRIIQSYLLDNDIDLDWQLDVITVYLDKDRRLLKLLMLEDVVI